jgi:hypothetical protein
MSTLMVSVLAFVSGIKGRLESEKGATATEYSLLVAFIAFLHHRRRHRLRHGAQRLGSNLGSTSAGTFPSQPSGSNYAWSKVAATIGAPRSCKSDAAHHPTRL